MKGIILAGGSGTRLHPLTLAVSKQLLPIYDKPMVYYPLSVLMEAGITEVLLISTPNDLPNFERLLGDGSKFGISISYKVQPSPDGLAQAFILGEEFIGDDAVALVLGDNIFYGAGFSDLLEEAVQKVTQKNVAVVFGNYVKDPERYGVASFDASGQLSSIEEKPTNPASNYAVVGLYFYPNSVIEVAKGLKPSKRGELEITAVNQYYLENKSLEMQILSRGFAWLDTGTHEALTEATEFVKAVEKRTGLKIACLEEMALIQKRITAEDLFSRVEHLKGDYYDYIKEVVLRNRKAN
ncbi:glucose-1-phosphate thymidylyltransferase RfbA [Nonlabens sp. Ci31]|jgi:glucose-1-phosphate thymidylyltransferase|uniref:glucose-1-phosphate thymidylyltransferase RfbA n=1 Tax=Nonlabens sp. Ci31 TaxID=2608253 RepID=UPI001464314C|nr:glucose-1-phosphate thymidylyltransferase RfbA [Nonlabens sp. Ci31]QJP34900.1 glucose-1-phosphate thymidylyltransferase RfbA [Nonlabens sp. Ci31]